MRWKLVIGGQQIAKTGQGLLKYYILIFHRQGLVAAVSTVIAPLILLAVMVRLLPPWGDNATSLLHTGTP